MFKARRQIPVLLVALGVLGPAGIAHAANSYTVTTTADSNDGACTPTLCSLRDAVVAADAAGGATTIAVPAGNYALKIRSTGSGDATNGDLDIDNNASVTIAGAGSGSTTIDADHIDRAFSVDAIGDSLSLSGMTIENGTPSSNSIGSGSGGGAIYDAGTLSLTGDVTLTKNQTPVSGGAILVNPSSGALTVIDSTLSGNSAIEEGGALLDLGSSSATLDGDRFTGNTDQESGGGAYLDSNLAGPTVVNQDEFDNNSVPSGNGGGGLVVVAGSFSSSGSSFIDNSANNLAGGIGVGGVSAISLVNATISGNQAPVGAGMYLSTSVPTTMTNDTIVFNNAGVGGGVYLPGDAATGSGSTGVRNTLIAQNTGGDCSNGSGNPSQFTGTEDAGNNLDSDGSCFQGDAASDKVGVVNPLVAQPADNGGPVLTDALEPASPAIDAGTDVDCPATDARGLGRPQGASCDIGAYELTPASLSLANSAPATANTGVPFDDTITVSNAGPASSTGTTLTEALPADTTLYGSSASQGSCSSAGFPATLTCQLGAIRAGSSATVTLLVAYAQPGSRTSTASASNQEGASVSGSETTTVLAPVAPAGGTAPTATTGAATGIGQTGATLNGQVAPGGQPTAYFFEYGTRGSYGSITLIVHTGVSPQNVSAAISGLKAGTTYHFRLVAINDSDSSFGSDRTFSTPRSRLVLRSGRLTVKKGKVSVPLTCASTTACAGSFSITARVSPKKMVRCTVRGKATYRIAAGRHKLVKARLTKSCLAALAAHHGKLAAKLTAEPETGQAGVKKAVTLR